MSPTKQLMSKMQLDNVTTQSAVDAAYQDYSGPQASATSHVNPDALGIGFGMGNPYREEHRLRFMGSGFYRVRNEAALNSPLFVGSPAFDGLSDLITGSGRL